ncbi:MAG: hypothetical protein Q9217_005910 [Psora testacea]
MPSDSPLAGKTVLITGGTKGIGGATSLLLANQGANIAINYCSDSASADALLDIIGRPEHCLAIKADAGSIPGIEKMVAATVEKFGKIDILIPCAGVSPMKDLEHTTEDVFERTIALNVKGPYFLVQKAIPHMPPSSHIVLLSSSLTTASTVSPAYLLYNTTKGAIEQMTRVLAKDLAKKNITVNAVAPGPTGTELFYKGKSEQLVKTIAGSSPFDRIGKPEEISQAIAFFCSDECGWVTGQTLRANGGMAV